MQNLKRKEKSMAEKCKFKTSVGGQALLEGIMMKGADKYAVAVRKPNGEIDVQVNETKTHKWAKLPFIRGIFTFIDSLITGYKCLMRSADISMGEDAPEDKSKFDLWVEKKFGEKAYNGLMIVAAVLGALLAIVLFMVIPTLLVGFINRFIELGFWKSVLEGIFKLIIFLSYMALVSKMKEIYRMFCYHGAEHKTISCYEAGEELTVENIKKHTRFHPRCGTSFLLIVILVSILVFAFLPWSNTFVRAGLKILALPLVMGIAYEIIRFAGRHNNIFTKIISAPGLWLQRLTTHEPDDKMIEVAIAAVMPVLPENPEECKW